MRWCVWHPGQLIHRVGRRGGTHTVWTPRWLCRVNMEVPLALPSRRAYPYYTGLHSKVSPSQQAWSKMLRDQRACGVTPGCKTNYLVYRRGRSYTQQRYQQRQYHTNWLTTLARLSCGTYLPGWPNSRINFASSSDVVAHRRLRWATTWRGQLRVGSPIFQTRPRVIHFKKSRKLTYWKWHFKDSYLRNSNFVSKSQTLKPKLLEWQRKVSKMWKALHYSQRFNHVAGKETTYNRFSRLSKYLEKLFYLPPATPVIRVAPVWSRRRRRGRQRRWYPGSMHWVFRDSFRSRRCVKLRSYLGLPLRAGLLPYVRPRRRHRRLRLVRRVGLRWVHRRRRRRCPRAPWVPRWRRRVGYTTLRVLSVYPQQQRWVTSLLVTRTSLRRLASTTVTRGTRWSTETVWRTATRITVWTNMYRTGYTTVGTRSRRRGGVVVKVPTLLSPAKSLVLLRRWFTRGVNQAAGRAWSHRVVTTAATTTVSKQQHDFVTTALSNAAVL